STTCTSFICTLILGSSFFSSFSSFSLLFFFFFFTDTATTEIYTLSLHDALPISLEPVRDEERCDREDRHPENARELRQAGEAERSEEHTSELQSRFDLVCRLLLEKKKKKKLRISIRTINISIKEYSIYGKV